MAPMALISRACPASASLTPRRCRPPPAPEQSGASEDCAVSENLLVNTAFSETSEGVWAYSQHAGDRSFSVTSAQGELAITRTGVEPWMLLKQKVAVPEINPSLSAKWVFSAELKGQVETEPVLHGFEHVAGLFLQPAASPMSAKMAEHEPNQGVWDWQRVEVSAAVLPGSKFVQAGFVHQPAARCGRVIPVSYSWSVLSPASAAATAGPPGRVPQPL